MITNIDINIDEALVAEAIQLLLVDSSVWIDVTRRHALRERIISTGP